jgi:hypothetical protein
MLAAPLNFIATRAVAPLIDMLMVDDLVIMYSRGSFDMNGFPFVALVRFECDPKSTETGPIEPASDGSKYALVWKTRAACPVSTRTSSSVSFFWWTLVALVLYLVGGTIYNVTVNGKSGKEAFPHSGLMLDILDFFTELFNNIRARLCGSSGGYQQI